VTKEQVTMDTKKIVKEIIGKYNSNNPFIIADSMNVTIIYSNMKNTLGFFSKYKRCKFIHLNNTIPEKLQTFVCAHELGHVILHPELNTPFLKQNTLFLVEKVEREANTFAVELLLPDKLLCEYPNCELTDIAKIIGIPDKLIDLKDMVIL
jgi:Zn-dependent peptidase ImmA (M78 family)